MHPYLSSGFITCESDLEKRMERMLPKEPYPHVNCGHKGYTLLLHAYNYIRYTCHHSLLTESINIYLGCGFCWAVDGNWKLAFPICMFPVKTSVPGLAGVNYPDVCTSQPVGSRAFCAHHLHVAQERGYPTRDFFKVIYFSHCLQDILNVM